MQRRIGMGGWVVVLAAMVACGGQDPGPDYDHLAFKGVSDPPRNVELDAEQILFEEGLAVQATPYPVGTDGHALRGEVSRAKVVSENENVLTILPGPHEESVVMIGAGIGTTRLLVSIQGVYVDAIPVVVSAQSTN